MILSRLASKLKGGSSH